MTTLRNEPTRSPKSVAASASNAFTPDQSGAAPLVSCDPAVLEVLHARAGRALHSAAGEQRSRGGRIVAAPVDDLVRTIGRVRHGGDRVHGACRRIVRLVLEIGRGKIRRVNAGVV